MLTPWLRLPSDARLLGGAGVGTGLRVRREHMFAVEYVDQTEYAVLCWMVDVSGNVLDWRACTIRHEEGGHSHSFSNLAICFWVPSTLA